MKPANEVERSTTNYICTECRGPIVRIRGEFTCSMQCGCRNTIYYFWCDRCGEEKEQKYGEFESA